MINKNNFVHILRKFRFASLDVCMWFIGYILLKTSLYKSYVIRSNSKNMGKRILQKKKKFKL